ncbi:MAG: HIT family protein [Actinomycetota bacterium]
MERLWAPWRMEYIGQSREGKDEGCLFCEKPKEGDDEKALIVARSELAFAMLNRYPYNSGHLMVAPFRHVGELEEVEDEESLDMQRLMQRCVTTLKDAMQPDGFNIGMNLGVVAGAGIPDHVHWHVVPRWNGDTNFMPTVGDTKVISEHISSLYSRLSRGMIGR